MASYDFGGSNAWETTLVVVVGHTFAMATIAAEWSRDPTCALCQVKLQNGKYRTLRSDAGKRLLKYFDELRVKGKGSVCHQCFDWL
jgi:hypothetical protein